MKTKVTINLDELVRLRNKVAYLEQRLELYEPKRTEEKITLLNADGSPKKGEYGLRKPGTKSLLDELPDTFTRDMVINLCGDFRRVKQWKYRGYITSDDTYTIFTKTENYKKRMYQDHLKRLTADKEIKMFTKSF